MIHDSNWNWKYFKFLLKILKVKRKIKISYIKAIPENPTNTFYSFNLSPLIIYLVLKKTEKQKWVLDRFEKSFGPI